jgi:hypothetical protein
MISRFAHSAMSVRVIRKRLSTRTPSTNGPMKELRREWWLEAHRRQPKEVRELKSAGDHVALAPPTCPRADNVLRQSIMESPEPQRGSGWQAISTRNWMTALIYRSLLSAEIRRLIGLRYAETTAEEKG